MTIVLPVATLHHWETLVNRFRGEYVPSESSSLVSELLILAIFLVLVALVGYLSVRHWVERLHQTRRALLVELCQAHELDRRQRAQLLRLAKALQEAEPARLFLQPERFDANAASQAGLSSADVAAMRLRLFGP